MPDQVLVRVEVSLWPRSPNDGAHGAAPGTIVELVLGHRHGQPVLAANDRLYPPKQADEVSHRLAVRDGVADVLDTNPGSIRTAPRLEVVHDHCALLKPGSAEGTLDREMGRAEVCLDPLLCAEHEATLATEEVVCALVVHQPLSRGQRQRACSARPVHPVPGAVPFQVLCRVAQTLALAAVMRFVDFDLVPPPHGRGGGETVTPLAFVPVHLAGVHIHSEEGAEGVPALLAGPVAVLHFLVLVQLRAGGPCQTTRLA
ncbi:hypothetical protein A1Q2_04393 [Trichosporon asahii var. asahii CBS 8904]|uniref:Uncharacterized protein n=1 Tax=Trichosporon asahii var. asahii (strain CBS 8904) TaxID=1220162 RepID=K1VB96_TRIAC|nr:hypothetical protein A1Q2_04393 [Trichosporon asahii var. asahii CBS 8904]